MGHFSVKTYAPRGSDLGDIQHNAVHAKIFIFDDEVCYVGSSNLTASGLERSLEGTVELDEPNAVAEWRAAFTLIKGRSKPAHLEDLAVYAQKTREHLLKYKVVKVDEGFFYDNQNAATVTSTAVTEIYEAAEAREIPFSAALRERIDASIEHQMEVETFSREHDLIAGPTATSPDISDEPAPTSEIPSRQLSERKVRVIEDFVRLAENSFGLPAWSNGISVAHAVIHPSAFNFLDEIHIDGKPLSIDRQVHSSLRQLGYDTFSVGLTLLFAKSGLLTRYGPAFCSTLESAFRGNGFLQTTWQRRLLPDPVMTDTDEKSMTLGSHTMKRLREDEAYRLFAFASVSLPFEQLIQFIEENWNPVVEYGSAVVEFAVGKDTKTRLQEIATSVRLQHRYGAYVKSGTEHDPHWTCELELVGKATAKGSGSSKRASEVDAAMRLEEKLARDRQWQAATRTYRRQTLRNYVDLGPWPLVCKLSLDPRTRAILEKFAVKHHIPLDAPQIYGCLIDLQIRAKERIYFNNAALAFAGSFAMRWLVSRRIVRSQVGTDHATLSNGLYVRLGGVSGISELYQMLGLGTYASENAVTEALQSLLASLVLFEKTDAAERYIHGLMDSIPRDALVEFIPDGSVSGKLDLIVAGLGPFDPKGDYITLLQEFVQHFDKAPPVYKTDRAGGPDHAPTFRAEVQWREFAGSSTASSAKAARREAAHDLLAKLKGFNLPARTQSEIFMVSRDEDNM